MNSKSKSSQDHHLSYLPGGITDSHWKPEEGKVLIAFKAPDDSATQRYWKLFQPGLSEGPFVGAYGRVLARWDANAYVSLTAHYTPDHYCYLSMPFLLSSRHTNLIESSEETKRFEPLGGVSILGADRVQYVKDESGGVAYLRSEAEINAAKQLCLKIMLDGDVITEATAKEAGYNPLHPVLMKRAPEQQVKLL